MQVIRFAAYKEQYKLNLKLAGPVILSQAGVMLVMLVDSAMVGRLGAVPLAGVSFGSTVFFFLFIFCMGISMGLTPVVGELYTTGNHRSSAKYLQNSLLLYLLAGVAATAIQLAFVPFMHMMGQPAEVVEAAIPYYKYLAWSMIPFMLYAVFKQFLEGVGNTKVTMYVVIISNVINIFLNWLLIYGKWGFPEMGAAGAGLATLISRMLAPVMMGAYFLREKSLRRYLRFFDRRFEWKRIVTLLKVGFPIGSQMLLEGSAFIVATLMMGWIGTLELAGNKIAMDIATLAFLMVTGVSTATTIRVSHELGRGNMKDLRMAANASWHIGLAWNTFTAVAIVLLRNHIPQLFTNDPEVVRMASHLLLFVAAFQFSDGLQAITIGILRGLQDVVSIMYIAFFSYIVINIPIGYLLAFHLGMGPGGLWIGFIFGLTSAAVLLIRRFRQSYARLLAGESVSVSDNR